MRWMNALRNAICVVVIGFVIGVLEGLSPDGYLSDGLRWIVGNVVYTLTVAILFYVVATPSLSESLRLAFMAISVYTLISILIGLALSAWGGAPLIMVLVDWLLVVAAAFVGTAAGAWVRTVRSRQQATSASGR